MSRTAILSDIHGNSIALDAVLDDIKKNGGVDQYWVLGDLAAIGHDPLKVLETLNKLPNLQCVHGNTDRYLVTGERPIPPFERISGNAEAIASVLHVISSFAWTEGALTLSGWMPWLEKLPLELRTTFPDGTRFLGVHAAPGTDDGPGINPATDHSELGQMAKNAGVDIICVGHTHFPLEMKIEGVHIFNLGSVSNPMPPDLRASYAILEADAHGYHLQHRYVNYDHQAVIAAIQTVKHPAAKFIINYQLGKNFPRWQIK